MVCFVIVIARNEAISILYFISKCAYCLGGCFVPRNEMRRYYFGISYILGSVFNNADFALELYVLKSAAFGAEPVGT